MKKLENISKKIGFTSTEAKVLLFILASFSAGLIVNIIKDKKNEKDFLEFDYKKEDSLFNAAAGEPDMAGRPEPGDTSVTVKEKKIASQSELLDFTKGKFAGKISKNTLSDGKVNINSAGIADLRRLPGIGVKTGEAIIEYRNKHGKIKSADELMNVKGIGKKKFDKIKNLIIVD